MEYISVREFRNQPSQTWKKLEGNKELVVTVNGKPMAVLLGIEEGVDLEVMMRDIRRTMALRSIDNIQQKAAEDGLDEMSDEDIEEEIRQARQQRKQRTGES